MGTCACAACAISWCTAAAQAEPDGTRASTDAVRCPRPSSPAPNLSVVSGSRLPRPVTAVTAGVGVTRAGPLAAELVAAAGPGREDGEQRSRDEREDETGRQQGQDHAVACHRRSPATMAQVTPQRALLAMVKLHIAVKFPRIVGDLDVDRWQAKVVPLRFAAKVHAYLSGNEQRLPSVWAPRRPAATAAPVPARTDLCSAADLAAGAVGPAGPPRPPGTGPPASPRAATAAPAAPTLKLSVLNGIIDLHLCHQGRLIAPAAR